MARLKAFLREALEALPLAYSWLRHGQPEQVLGFDAGIGDEFLCSAVLRELKRRGAGNLWMVTHHPELFRFNPDVTLVVKMNRRGVRLFFERRKIRPRMLEYAPYIAGRHVQPQKHVITTLCASVGLTGPVERRPYLFLQPSELAWGSFGPRQIAIQSSGASAKYAAETKEWYPARFQELVTHYARDHVIVQVGSARDPLLHGAVDLRGKTSIRQTAAVLHHSAVFIGLAGFLQHLARSVNCRSVIIYGGRELPTQTGYTANVNLTSQPVCSPCWLYTGCEYAMKCMNAIDVDSAIAAVDQQLAGGGQDLAEDWEECSGENAAAKAASSDFPPVGQSVS